MNWAAWIERRIFKNIKTSGRFNLSRLISSAHLCHDEQASFAHFSLERFFEETSVGTLPQLLLLRSEMFYRLRVADGQDIFQVFMGTGNDVSRNHFAPVHSLDRLNACCD